MDVHRLLVADARVVLTVRIVLVVVVLGKIKFNHNRFVLKLKIL